MARAATDRGWDDLFRKLGPRGVDRALRRAGGRARGIAARAGLKVLRPRLPKVTGDLRRAVHGTKKGTVARSARGLLRWGVRWTADPRDEGKSVPYWGPIIQRDDVQADYVRAQDAAYDSWVRHADAQITRSLREAVRGLKG